MAALPLRDRGPSLRWLIHLQRRLEGLPLLVVAGTRPPEQARSGAMVKEIVGDPTAAVVRPMALCADSVARIAREHFGRDADREFVDACWRATGGNPLFVWALLDTIRSEGLEPSAANAGRVDEIGPEPVTRAVSLRLSRLPSEATVLARAVAVLGDRAELRHAAALAGIDRELAGHAATTLARADLLDFEMPLAATEVELGEALLLEPISLSKEPDHLLAGLAARQAPESGDQRRLHLAHLSLQISEPGPHFGEPGCQVFVQGAQGHVLRMAFSHWRIASPEAPYHFAVGP